MHVYIHKKQKIPKRFYLQKPDTFQKARQFPLRFIYRKPDFHEIFEVRIYIQKS